MRQSGFQFERVKIPAGGGLAFETTDENGQPKPVPEITGVILHKHPVNCYWPDKFTGEHNPPACVALDGLWGVGNPGGDCSKCPFNQWESDGEGGRGKACKNLHRVYVLPENDILPYLFTMPPTSLVNLRDYMRFLTSKAKKPFYMVATAIRLVKAQSGAGITYSRATFTKVGDVPPEKLAGLKAYIEALLPLMKTVKVEDADYNTAESEPAQQQKPEQEAF
jgi:hypothetical protein